MASGDEPTQNRFQLVAGHMALDFVNTLDDRFAASGVKELIPEYRDLVQFVEQSGQVSRNEARRLSAVDERLGQRLLNRAHVLREALASLLYASVDETGVPPAALAEVAGEIQQARQHQQARWRKGHLEWVWERSAPELPLWLLSSAAEALLASAAGQVRACDNVSCRWLFHDTSKNHSRRWCDMKICGNRMKARRYKTQHG